MKVLQITPYYKPAFIYGGPINSISKLCEELRNNGIYIKTLTTNANGNEDLVVKLSTETNIDGIVTIYFKRLTKGNTFVSIGLWKYLWKHAKNYDIIHIHTWWNLLVLISTIICRIKKVKVIMSPRGMLSEYIINTNHKYIKKVIHYSIGRWALKGTIFHATTIQEGKECKKLISTWKGFVLPNMIEFPPIKIVKNKDEKIVLIFLSRVDPKKGLEFVFEALKKTDKNILLKIAGDGKPEYIDKLKNLSIELGIEDRIHWVGWLDQQDKFKALMSANAFILTSYNENFGNSIIEAIYVGTPVIITKEVGLSDFVMNNDLGWLVDFTPESIINAITELIINSEKVSHINTNGQDIIIKNFTGKHLANQYIKNYQEHLN